MLQGKKTYLVAAGVVLSSVGAYLTGNIDVATAINQALTGLGLATLRMGVASK